MTAEWPLTIVDLKVLDLEREVEFYERFGLSLVGEDERGASMGADGVPILHLRPLTAGKERPRHTAGLYHFAILLPSEEELGGFLRRALEERLPLTGTSDHLVSQALYFDDPEGNGIEVYADRPRSQWRYPNGNLDIGTVHLDFERLLRIASEPQAKFSPGTVLGHMHLNVSNLDRSQAFYESMGMEVMARAGHVMRFMSWDGYHHHLGLNILEGRGAARVEPEVRGLEAFHVRRVDGLRLDPDGVAVAPS